MSKNNNDEEESDDHEESSSSSEVRSEPEARYSIDSQELRQILEVDDNEQLSSSNDIMEDDVVIAEPVFLEREPTEAFLR